MATQGKKDINYLNKDFNQFRENLINFAKTYYKNTYNDFNEGDPGMMWIEMASYVGDVLSFYNDYNLQEALINHTVERNNIVEIAQALGYKPKPAYPARTKLDIYQLVPSIIGAGVTTPDWNYALTIKPGMEVRSNEDSAIVFRTLDTVDFSVSGSNNPTDITVYKTNSTNGMVDYYLLKKTVQVEAGTQKTYTYQVTDNKPYLEITIPDFTVISIDEVIDSDGNNWYEVPFLAQDTIFIETANVETNNPDLAQFKTQTPYLLKMKRVPKRFVTHYLSDNRIQLRFGPGFNILPDEIITPNPDNVGQPYSLGVSKINTTWDPANNLYTKSYGQAPSNTTLTIKYTTGGGIKSNVPVGILTDISKIEFYTSNNLLNATTLNSVRASVACSNLEPATGGRGEESTDEIRDNAMAFFAAQDRVVNKEDYIVRAYSMPSKYGSISKAYIIQDEQLNFYDYSARNINPFGLNLYVLSYNDLGQLTQANNAIKENLKTYLSKFKILTDSINIKDAFIINIAVSFQITVLPDYVANEVLFTAIGALKDFFKIENWQINQPIVINDVIRTIANVKGVQSVIGVKFYNQFDSSKGYVPNVYNIDTSIRNGVLYPSLDPSIFEVRFPSADIFGRCVSY